jgi:hypothetical protein
MSLFKDYDPDEFRISSIIAKCIVIPAKAGISLFHPMGCHSSERWNLLNPQKIPFQAFHGHL